MIRIITAQEAMTEARTPGTILLDVRSAAEIAATGTAQGAICIPATQVWRAAQANTPETNLTLRSANRVILFCAVGARAEAVGEQLTKLGFAEILMFKSFSDWVSAGGKVRAA